MLFLKRPSPVSFFSSGGWSADLTLVEWSVCVKARTPIKATFLFAVTGLQRQMESCLWTERHPVQKPSCRSAFPVSDLLRWNVEGSCVNLSVKQYSGQESFKTNQQKTIDET